ncbi:MAG: hypothetical protein IJC16_09880 [Rikenellaceae bacterium]|nr:hypothetical protein [Rikenellaceae bacterium]
MLGLGAFRRKPRTFEYKPRHFDPEAERREERRRELLGDDYTAPGPAGDTGYKPGDYVRKRHIGRGIAGKRVRISKQSMAMRIAAVLCLLALVLWILLT